MQDYSKLHEITVRNQAALDEIPLDFKGRIYIDCKATVYVKQKYYLLVVARGNSSVEAWENSSVVAMENSSVVARENSSVEAMENSSVEAWENSSVVARGNTQIVDRQINGKIQLSGNSRTVYMPKSIHDLMDFYGTKHTKTIAFFYKAVHKLEDGTYHSSHNASFTYKVGETLTNECDTSLDRDCSYGLHISHLAWALDFGRDWGDLAILEVEVKIKDIIMPENTDGKVRVPELTVLREVPLEECGIYGKILANRRAKP